MAEDRPSVGGRTEHPKRGAKDSRLPMRRALAQRELGSGTTWTWSPPGIEIAAAEVVAGLPFGINQEDHLRALESAWP